MEISPLLLSALLFFSLLFGIILGVINDINRIIRVFFGVKYSDKKFNKIRALAEKREKIKKKRISVKLLNLLIFIQDFLLMMSLGCGIVILNYYFNDGRFRLFSLICAVVGFLLYYFTIGKIMMLISEPITLILKLVFSTICYYISYPFAAFIRYVLKIINKLIRSIKNRIAKKENMSYNIKKTTYMYEKVNFGFLSKDI